MDVRNRTKSRYRGWLVAGVLALSIVLWLQGLLSSQIYDPKVRLAKQTAAILARDAGAERTTEVELARAYWLRYEDVRTHPIYGEDGPLGITGAGEHYRHHGRREGRIYAPVAAGEDPERERLLAEAYWHRYPEIADSQIWGRKSALGILGPRDHYRYIGSRRKMLWGIPETEAVRPPQTIPRKPN